MLDIIVLAVILLFALVGAKKGFIKSFVDFVGAFAAMIAAAILSLPAAEWIHNTFFRDALMEKITMAVTDMDAEGAVKTVFEGFPELVIRALSAVGITQNSVMTQVEGSTLGIAEAITDAISPMLIGLVRVLAMVVLFILLLVVIRAVGSLISGLFSLPLLNSINKLLGAVFGILLAFVAIWVVLACVQAFLPLLSAELQMKILDAQESSALYAFLYQFNPAYSMIG